MKTYNGFDETIAYKCRNNATLKLCSDFLKGHFSNIKLATNKGFSCKLVASFNLVII